MIGLSDPQQKSREGFGIVPLLRELRANLFE
jgi:hypothetical protein